MEQSYAHDDLNTIGASPASCFTTRDRHLLVLNESFPKCFVSACLHGCNMAAFSKQSTLKAVFENICFPNRFRCFRVNRRFKCNQKVTDTGEHQTSIKHLVDSPPSLIRIKCGLKPPPKEVSTHILIWFRLLM